MTEWAKLSIEPFVAKDDQGSMLAVAFTIWKDIDMEMRDFLNLAALVIIPIVAVLIGQDLQARAKKRDDKMRVFEVLMAHRVLGLSPEVVKAYTMIYIPVADDKEVCKKWSDYYEALCVEDPDEAQLADDIIKQTELLKAMASSLGYKDELSQAALDTKYVPVGMVNAMQQGRQQQQDYGSLLNEVITRLANNQPFPSL